MLKRNLLQTVVEWMTLSPLLSYGICLEVRGEIIRTVLLVGSFDL